MTSATGNNSRRALTLIELLVSVTILAAGTVLIMQALARGAQVLESAKIRSAVYEFASAKIADIALASQEGQEIKPGGQFRIGRQQYQWAVERGLLDDEPSFELLTLVVSWRQGRYGYDERFSTVTRAAAAPAPQ